MSNRIELSRAALLHNLSMAKKLAGEACLVAPCVKANAYGHGLVAVAQVLAEAGADFFCVFNVAEAMELREAGISQPIIVMGSVTPREVETIVQHDFRVFLFDREIAQLLSAEALRQQKKAHVHVKIDTGMGRFGIFYSEAMEFLTEVRALPGLIIEGLATHFASSDAEGENPQCHEQFNRFQQVRAAAQAQGIQPALCHVSNTAAALRYPEMRLDMIRPGRLIYGYLPYPYDIQTYTNQGITLKQVISVKSEVGMVKRVPAGTSISYGATYTTTRDSVLAVIPMGYADGVSRFLSNQGAVLIHGQRAPIRGKVCMNAFTVDVTDIPGVQIGDEVVVLGEQGADCITCYEMADMLMHTLPYNVLTAFQNTLPRTIV